MTFSAPAAPRETARRVYFKGHPAMIARKDLTMPLVISSLRSQICPACGGPKKSAQTLCRNDYYRLPAGLRSALYARVGAGYEEALTDAFTHLGTETFHQPEVA